ncbi:ABC transporter permease [Teredinibacter waterburyi]|jgi:ABC-type transport system, involved in lipoprotein release, permease component|uniref:ABC transporter permease n=1 Tax=Teredinibacter waterburyi TaxID=1500538 RepID=UPI00165ED36A|nr:FtsX-like permease family protein [Teredinibacter waterburyi]
MSFYTLIYQSIIANKSRSSLLVITISVAFLVYGVLGALRFSMFGGTDEFGKNRLIMTHEAGMTQPLPINYRDRIKQIEGVSAVTPATWIGAYYQDPNKMLMAFAVQGESWIQQHPEMQMSNEHRNNFLTTTGGMLVSEALMRKYGWKVGDRIPLKSIMFFPDNGEDFWPFTVSGTFENSAEAGGRNYIITHYKYLNEARTSLRDTAGTYVITATPGVSVENLALRIDEHFSQFYNRTSTTTDRAFHTEFFKQLGDISLMIQSILFIAFTSIILVVCSTLTLTVRQRTRDIGILKMLGFGKTGVLALIISEGFLLILLGAIAGLLLAMIANHLISVNLPDLLPNLSITPQVLTEMLAIAIAIGTIVCSIPALLAATMKPIDAFSREA